MDETAPVRERTTSTDGQPQPDSIAKPASRRMVIVVAALFAVVIAGIWFIERDTQRGLRTEVAKRLTDSDAALALVKARESDLANELREARAKLALLETRLSESQSQQDSLEVLYRELAPSRDELALNEVEQVLMLASQQLAIAGNVQAALAALQLADAKLARIDRPQLIPLRRALSRDVDRLKSVPFVDVAGMSLKLDQALAAISMLPLARDERLPLPEPPSPPSEQPAWTAYFREAWNEVKSLVRIEVADRPAAPLVPPAQEYFLRENLRLRLLTARVALVTRDDAGFKTDVKAATAWVKQYFDMRSKPVAGLVATLTQLAATPLPAQLPDLSGSLTALQTVQATRQRAAERGSAAARPR
ncbi:MAG: uroporphyrinogen-III C-methyltransferase [Burkholderiales bacterium]|nr:uroporphyrinogen-III C-methyltransferase [Burkholderiales bacterium]